MNSAKNPQPSGQSSTKIAEAIIGNADRDVVFSVRILGESRDYLQQHFQDFIRDELERKSVNFGDHPMLNPFIKSHAYELTEFVTTGVGLHHQLSLREFEELSGDPLKLFRVDLWDSLSSHIQRAETQFVSDIGGLQTILAAVEEERSLQAARSENKADGGATSKND